MTPLHGMSFTYDLLYERRFQPGLTVVTATTDDNPHLDQEAKEKFFAGLTDEERQARREGRFVHFGGLVYGEFSDRHTVALVDPDHLCGQQVVVGIDPGIRWTAVVFGAFDSDNSLLAFDELFLTDSTVESTAKDIKEKLHSWGLSMKARDMRPLFVIDPSARNRSLVNAESVEGEFARFGIYCSPGQNQVEAGVFSIKRRLQSEPPALLVARNCERLIWEFGRYRISSTPDGSFVVVKTDDHAVDALRYVAMFRPWLPVTAYKQQPFHRQHGIFDPRQMASPVESPPMGA